MYIYKCRCMRLCLGVHDHVGACTHAHAIDQPKELSATIEYSTLIVDKHERTAALIWPKLCSVLCS